MPKPLKTPFAGPYETIIDRLIERRKAIGMTQTELGERYGEDQSFVSRVERRQRRMDVWEFVRWCRALDVEPVVSAGAGLRAQGDQAG